MITAAWMTQLRAFVAGGPLPVCIDFQIFSFVKFMFFRLATVVDIDATRTGNCSTSIRRSKNKQSQTITKTIHWIRIFSLFMRNLEVMRPGFDRQTIFDFGNDELQWINHNWFTIRKQQKINKIIHERFFFPVSAQSIIFCSLLRHNSGFDWLLLSASAFAFEQVRSVLVDLQLRDNNFRWINANIHSLTCCKRKTDLRNNKYTFVVFSILQYQTQNERKSISCSYRLPFREWLSQCEWPTSCGSLPKSCLRDSHTCHARFAPRRPCAPASSALCVLVAAPWPNRRSSDVVEHSTVPRSEPCEPFVETSAHLRRKK